MIYELWTYLLGERAHLGVGGEERRAEAGGGVVQDQTLPVQLGKNNMVVRVSQYASKIRYFNLTIEPPTTTVFFFFQMCQKVTKDEKVLNKDRILKVHYRHRIKLVFKVVKPL